MNYERITDSLIKSTMKEFNLEKIYQEFLDSLVEFDDFKSLNAKDFQKYVDNLELKME